MGIIGPEIKETDYDSQYFSFGVMSTSRTDVIDRNVHYVCVCTHFFWLNIYLKCKYELSTACALQDFFIHVLNRKYKDKETCQNSSP